MTHTYRIYRVSVHYPAKVGDKMYIGTVGAESPEQAVEIAYRRWQCEPVGSYGRFCFIAEA